MKYIYKDVSSYIMVYNLFNQKPLTFVVYSILFVYFYLFLGFLYSIMFVFSLSDILKVLYHVTQYDLKRRRFIMLNVFPPCFMKQRGAIKMFQLENIFKNRLLKIFSVKYIRTCCLNIFKTNLLL